jgi:abequosyltransferase
VSTPRLSICIATFKRGAFIAETLDSIVPQLSDSVELLVVDGASPDDTESVMRRYVERHPEVCYFRQAENGGVDGDYDNAVQYARGTYCWLMTDDDLLKPNAVQRVLAALEGEPDLVMVNTELRNANLRACLNPRLNPIQDDRRYSASEFEDFFRDAASHMSFIGTIIVRRALWLQRERKRYYGTLFIHVGILLQKPLESVSMIADPLIVARFGNAMWTPRSFEIWMKKWPDLIWSFDSVSAKTKRQVIARYPAHSLRELLFQRAIGAYDISSYRNVVQPGCNAAWRWAYFAAAFIPERPLNTTLALYFGMRSEASRLARYLLRLSRSATPLTRWLTRDLA